MFTRHSKRSILMVLLAALASLPTLAESQTTLCFDRNGIVYVKEMKTGNVQEVGQGTDPHISPAGNLVVYTIAVGIVDRVIAVVDPASNQAKIYVGPQTLRQWNAQWSPDRKSVV